MPHIDSDNTATGLEAEERMVEVDAVIMLAAFLLIGFLAFSFCGCRRGEALPLAEGLTPKKGTDAAAGRSSPSDERGGLQRARTMSTLARGASSMLKPHEVMANDHGAAPSRSIAGVYECHEAALLSQDDVSIDATGWRHVTVEPCGGRRRYGSEFRWKTRSGKQWTLSPMHEDGVYAVGHTCPFFVDGHTRCEVERDGEDNVVALIGPFGMRFERVSGPDASPPQKKPKAKKGGSAELL